MKRIILHADMDAFFAAVEQNDNPLYKNKPVIIGSDPKMGKGRGVVSTASYEARKFGVHSGMPISTAFKKCPNGIFIKPNMKRYVQISKVIFSIFNTFSPLVEGLSIDEAFIDCTGCKALFGSPTEIALKIKKKIYDETKLTVSIGIAGNKSIAKILSELQKPDGLTICPEGEEKDFIKNLDISYLWGAGKKTIEILNQMGFSKIDDISSKTIQEMSHLLGKNGEHLWKMANGIDDRRVVEYDSQAKSISKEITFDVDTSDTKQIKHFINILSDKVSRKIRKNKIFAKTISIKLRYQNFETITRSYTFMNFINDYIRIRDKCEELFLQNYDNSKKIRLIGVSLTNFSFSDKEYNQLDLFDMNQSSYIINNSSIDHILDDMKTKYGCKINRGSLLKF